MTAPHSPDRVTADAQAIQDLAAKIAETYRALFASGYHRDTAAAGGGSRPVAKDGSANGPTAGVAGSREVTRAKLGAVADTMAAVSVLLGAALITLHKVGEFVDRDADHGPDDLDALIPRTVLKSEIAEARARQARRDAEEALRLLRLARADAGRERARAKPKTKPKPGRAA